MDQIGQTQVTSQNFYQLGQEFIKKYGNEKLPVISPGSEAFDAWREYFQRYLRWTPVVLQEILDGRRKEMTVPSEFPQTFDRTFIEALKWTPPAPKQLTNRLSHPTMDELRRRYGPNWGLKVISHEKQAKKEWKRFTDDELRAIYGKREREAAQQPAGERKDDPPTETA